MKTCSNDGCDNPCHSHAGKLLPRCKACHKQFRSANDHERGEGPIMEMLAFPEPEKFIAYINSICNYNHKDKRTIEHRKGVTVHENRTTGRAAFINMKRG